jgi:hypothetical protein
MSDGGARATGTTYWHLAGIAAGGRAPSDYEIASSRLHYYVGRGFEVTLPMGDWYRRFQSGSPLSCDDWDRFADPRETTYTAYVALQQAKEARIDELFAAMQIQLEEQGDRHPTAAWLDVLDRVLGPMRYLGHGLQMLSAYVGQMAPGSRITIAAALQTADELRRIDRLAYRAAQLRLAHPGFGATAKARWQSDPAWQPARRLIETLLTTYDWGEAFVALNLCVKPVLDGFLMIDVGEMGAGAGDGGWRDVARLLQEDCAWHAAWAAQLCGVALAANPGNGDVVRGMTGRWLPRAEEAAMALAADLGSDGLAAAARTVARCRGWLDGMGARA